ncbi:MAG: thioredoxin domain-containing protein [Candidatus Nomurabacteria bacterium]|nr:thioredoxin domain-containing protein [Candidatus Nomurabacteria bacterium]
MQNSTTNIKVFFSVIGLLIVGSIAGFIIQSKITSSSSVPAGKYDTFAQCLKDQGATFYGAFWCPHCKAQEESLGMTREKLESIGLYVECSLPDASGQTQICKDKKIEGYPTWEFKDGSRVNESPLQVLADKTSCILPK